MKPFAESCVQNRDPILNVLRPLLANCREVLEIGSGTGQHAVYFAEAMPHIHWHTSDIEENHAGIQMWLDEAGLANVESPLGLNVTQPDWPALHPDAIFSANTLHIMDWDMVRACIAGVGRLLGAGGLYVVYGPFNYNGEYTNESNARFDQWLAQHNAGRAIRNFEDVDALANQAGMVLKDDFAMPANNRILCWEKG